MVVQTKARPPKLIGGEKLSKTDRETLKRLLAIDKAEKAAKKLKAKIKAEKLAKLKAKREARAAAHWFERKAICQPLADTKINIESPIDQLEQSVSAVCGIDWITATGWVAGSYVSAPGEHGEIIEMGIPSLEKTLEYLQSIVSSFWAESADFLDEDAYSIRGYNRAVSWFSGRVKICWAVDGEGFPKFQQRCYFSVSGSLLEQLDFHKQCDLMKSLFIDFGFRPTRLDVYVRDFNYLVLPSQLKGWADAGHLCRFQHENFKYIEDGPSGKAGATFYAGRRTKNGVSGDCLYRCYDEKLEARSPVPAIKHEAEWSGHKVKNLVQRFAVLLENKFDTLTGKMDEEAFTQFCLESSVGAGVLDFRQGKHTEKLDSRVPVSEWAAFTDGISKVRIQGKIKKVEMDRFPIAAFVHQWGRKLARESNKDARFRVEALIQSLALTESGVSRIITQAIQSGERRLNIPTGQRLFNKEYE